MDQPFTNLPENRGPTKRTSEAEVGMGQNSTTRGTQVLVLVSVYQHFGVTLFLAHAHVSKAPGAPGRQAPA